MRILTKQKFKSVVSILLCVTILFTTQSCWIDGFLLRAYAEGDIVDGVSHDGSHESGAASGVPGGDTSGSDDSNGGTSGGDASGSDDSNGGTSSGDASGSGDSSDGSSEESSDNETTSTDGENSSEESSVSDDGSESSSTEGESSGEEPEEIIESEPELLPEEPIQETEPQNDGECEFCKPVIGVDGTVYHLKGCELYTGEEPPECELEDCEHIIDGQGVCPWGEWQVLYPQISAEGIMAPQSGLRTATLSPNTLNVEGTGSEVITLTFDSPLDSESDIAKVAVSSNDSLVSAVLLEESSTTTDVQYRISYNPNYNPTKSVTLTFTDIGTLGFDPVTLTVTLNAVCPFTGTLSLGVNNNALKIPSSGGAVTATFNGSLVKTGTGTCNVAGHAQNNVIILRVGDAGGTGVVNTDSGGSYIERVEYGSNSMPTFSYENVNFYSPGTAVIEMVGTWGHGTLTAVTQTITVKQEVEVTISAPGSLTYDGEAKAATATVLPASVDQSAYEIQYSDNGGTSWVTTAPVDPGTYKAKVNFTGSLGELYVLEIGTAECEFTITKATVPNITFPTANDATYGDSVGDVTFGGGSSGVPGTFRWKQPDNILGSAGTTGQMMEFVPDEPALYNVAEQSVSINVNKVKLAVSGTQIEQSKPYDGTTAAAVTSVGTLANLKNGDVQGAGVILTATATYDTAAAGTGKAVDVVYSLTGAKAANYDAPDPIALTADIEVIVGAVIWKLDEAVTSDSDIVYTGADQSNRIKAYYTNTSLAHVELDVTISGTFRDVGDYGFTASFKGSDADKDNYTLTNYENSYSIIQAAATFQVTNNTYGFDTSGHMATVIQTPAQTPVLSASDDYNVTYKPQGQSGPVYPNAEYPNGPVNAGVYDIYVTITNDNFKHSDGTSTLLLPEKLTINKAEASFSVTPPNTFTYDEEKHTATVEQTASEIVRIPADKYRVSYSPQADASTVIDAFGPSLNGVYDVYVEILDENYVHKTFGDRQRRTVGTLTITKTEVSFDITSQSIFTYDSNKHFVTVEQTASETVRIPVNKYRVSYSPQTTPTTVIDASGAVIHGLYDVYVEILDENYVHKTYGGQQRLKIGVMTINAATVSFDVRNFISTYSGEKIKAVVEQSGLEPIRIPLDKYEVTYSPQSDPLSVYNSDGPVNNGVYDIFVEILDDNYMHYTTLDQQRLNVGALTINKAQVSFDVSSTIRPYNTTPRAASIVQRSTDISVIPRDKYTVTYTPQGMSAPVYSEAGPVEIGMYDIHIAINDNNYTLVDPVAPVAFEIWRGEQPLSGISEYYIDKSERQFDLSVLGVSSGIEASENPVITYSVTSGGNIISISGTTVKINGVGDAKITAKASQTPKYNEAEMIIDIHVLQAPYIKVAPNKITHDSAEIMIEDVPGSYAYSDIMDLKFYYKESTGSTFIPCGGEPSPDKSVTVKLDGLKYLTEYDFMVTGTYTPKDSGSQTTIEGKCQFITPYVTVNGSDFSGVVTDVSAGKGGSITVGLAKSNKIVAAVNNLASGDTFTFTGVGNGTYNLIATNGRYRAIKAIEIRYGVAQSSLDITIGNVQTVLDIASGIPSATVGGLENLSLDPNLYTEQDRDLVENNGGSVIFTLQIEPSGGSGFASDKPLIDEMKRAYENIGLYFDISLYKTAYDANGRVEYTENISELNNDSLDITIFLPDFMRKKFRHGVIHCHNGGAMRMSSSYHKYDNAISFTLNQMSNFAVTYSDYPLDESVARDRPESGTISPIGTSVTKKDVWERAAEAVKASKDGGTVRVTLSDGVTTCPSSLLRELYSRDVTLIIVWEGDTIVINGRTMQKPKSGSYVYKLSELEDLYGITVGSQILPETIADLENPTTGGDDDSIIILTPGEQVRYGTSKDIKDAIYAGDNAQKQPGQAQSPAIRTADIVPKEPMRRAADADANLYAVKDKVVDFVNGLSMPDMSNTLGLNRSGRKTGAAGVVFSTTAVLTAMMFMWAVFHKGKGSKDMFDNSIEQESLSGRGAPPPVSDGLTGGENMHAQNDKKYYANLHAEEKVRKEKLNQSFFMGVNNLKQLQASLSDGKISRDEYERMKKVVMLRM